MNWKAIGWTAAICFILFVVLANGLIWFLLFVFFITGVVGMVDWYGDGDGRQFPGRWKE